MRPARRLGDVFGVRLGVPKACPNDARDRCGGGAVGSLGPAEKILQASPIHGRERSRARASPKVSGVRATTAALGATAATRKAVDAVVGAVESLVDSAVERVLISNERVTSAAEAKRLLAGSADAPELADKIQKVIVLAAPAARILARGARFARVPWVMVASSSLSIGVTVRAGVRELQVLASLLAYRVEQTTGAASDPALIKKAAIDLYLRPRRTPDLSDDKLRLVRLTRKWLLGGIFGRNTSKRAAKALDAAERLDDQTLTKLSRPK
jgi:hypothetical protein